MADETRDISGYKQLSIVIRAVDSEVTIASDQNQRACLFKEYFLGFIKLDEFDANSLTKEIVKFLLSLDIDFNYSIAMYFDGASIMSGKHGGIQALLRQRFIPRAIYVHCYVHKLNLVICDVTKNVPYLPEFYSIINKILNYFHASSVANETFQKLQHQLKIPKSLDFSLAHTLISAVIDQIGELRSEEEFCIQHGTDINVKLKQKRRRTTSTRLKNFLVTSTVSEREELDDEIKYRTRVYYPMIDSIINKMKNRFSQTNMDILRSISFLSPDSQSFLESEDLKSLCDMLHCDIGLLSNEIQVLKRSNSKTIVDLYFELLPLRRAFPTIVTLFVGALTIPVSSTTTECTFSKLKLIKTSARNSMSDDRLSNLALLAIESDFLIDYEHIVDSFAIQHKNSRILLK